MTDNVDDKSTDDLTDAEGGDDTEAEIIHKDDMLDGLEEAEAEIAAEEAAVKAETEDDGEEVKVDEAKTEEPEAKEEGEPKKGEPESSESPMIPKARFDQVNSEKIRLQEALNYTQGIVDTQGQMLKDPARVGDTGEDGKVKAQAEPDANDHGALIAKAENDILAAAQQYEDGDITLVEFEAQRTELARSIRDQADLRTMENIEGVKQAAVDVVSQNNVEIERNKTAAVLVKQYPYVAAIDGLPEHVSKGVWDQIRSEATGTLVEKGINPADGTRASDTALMEEMAALTEIYGPKYAGVIAEDKASQKSGELSETAQNRSDKLDLSQQQPPAMTGSSSDKRTDLTEADIINMDEDKLADLMESAPELVKKAVGLKTL